MRAQRNVEQLGQLFYDDNCSAVRPVYLTCDQGIGGVWVLFALQKRRQN